MALSPALVDPSPAALADHLAGICQTHGWTDALPLLRQVLADVEAAFHGRRPGYRAIDMHYHDLRHTLQATVCLADLVAGQQATPNAGVTFDRRIAELAVISALLHDIGFLKFTEDPEGTGAKYTLIHERRSCDFARAYLPDRGLTPAEIDLVCGAIRCTGPRNRISAQSFPHATARRMACLLVTADYISQMSAPDYPEKLDALFAEFVEAFAHEGVPLEKRPYVSATELKRRTPDFWDKFVRPMLDTEADGVHRFLITGQTNPYLDAVADNIAVIRRQFESGSVPS